MKFFWLKEGTEAADEDLSLSCLRVEGAGWLCDRVSSSLCCLLFRGGFCGVMGLQVDLGTW